MNPKEPIIFDPDHPIAHYERARKLKKKSDRTLGRCRIVSAAAFVIGTACVLYNPGMMALNAFFGLLFCILSLTGCWLKRQMMCLFAIPLGLTASLIAGFSGSGIAYVGAAVFFIASGLEIFSINAVAEHNMLKQLPGFPFFDVSMDNISFAAKDRFGSDQFIDSSEFNKEKEHIKLVPVGEPSENMEEIFSEEQDIPEEKNIADDGEQKDMVWDTDGKRKDKTISDVELFG